MTKRLRAVIDMTGRDPFQIRAACEDFCNEHLLGEWLAEDDATRQQIADGLLADYLATIDPQTTGADSLVVSVVEH